MSYPQYDPSQPGYQHPYYYQPYAPQDHPQATLALILGILGIALCGVISPFAWVIGKRAVTEIDASGGMISGRSSAHAGHILGLVGTILLIVSVVFMVLYIVVVVAVIAPAATSG